MSTKLIYRNSCVPQEYITENGKWYLDSDVNSKLSGSNTIDLGSSSLREFNYNASKTITAAENLFNGTKFIYIKNTGTSDISISLNGNLDAGEYRIKLESGDVFSTKSSANAQVWAKES